MARSGRKKCISFSSFRRRQQAANKRFCIIWINRMVNKQVEKRIADLRTEFLLRNDALREDMMTELQELKVLAAKEAKEKPLYYNKLDQPPSMTSRLLGKEEEHENNSEEDDQDDAKSLGMEKSSFHSVENPSDNNHKPPKHDREDIILNIFLDIFSDETNSVPHDVGTSSEPPQDELEEFLKMFLDGVYDSETSHVSNDATAVSQTATFKQEEVVKTLLDAPGSSSNVSVGSVRSQAMVDSKEEERSRNLLHAKPNSMTKELRCETEKQDTTKDDEISLMEKQWKEWMDKQEMRETDEVKLPVDQHEPENQGGAAPPASEKQTKQNVQGVDTMTKMKTYFSDIFKNRFTSYKWERLDDED